MDTSFLRHVYGLVGVKCTATHYKTNKIVLDIESSKTKKRGPCCGEYTLVKNGTGIVISMHYQLVPPKPYCT